MRTHSIEAVTTSRSAHVAAEGVEPLRQGWLEVRWEQAWRSLAQPCIPGDLLGLHHLREDRPQHDPARDDESERDQPFLLFESPSGSLDASEVRTTKRSLVFLPRSSANKAP